jgi:hypothetical protein
MPEFQGTNRRDLADAVLEYTTDLSQFIGSSVLPPYFVESLKGEFDKVAVSEGTKTTGNLKRGRKGKFPTIEHVTTSDTFACVESALSEGMDRHLDPAALGRVLRGEIDISQLLALHLMRAYEVEAAAAVFNTSTFTANDVGTEWNNSGNPVNDIQDAKLSLIQQLGGAMPPDAEICLALSSKVRKEIIQNSNFQALLAGGNGGAAARNLNPADSVIADILDVNQFFHSPAQNDGADIWDDEYAMLFIRRQEIGDGALLRGVQMGRTFMVSDEANDPSVANPWNAATWDEDNPPVRTVGVWHIKQEKILTTEAAYLIGNVHT